MTRGYHSASWLKNLILSELLQFEIMICLLHLGQMKIWPFLMGIWIFKFLQESIFSFGDYWWTLTNKTKNMVMWWFFMQWDIWLRMWCLFFQQTGDSTNDEVDSTMKGRKKNVFNIAIQHERPRDFVTFFVEVNLGKLPVVPHKAVAEVSKIGNL